MYAIVKTGGKQYKVAVDDIIEVEKLAVGTTGEIELEVVFIADGARVITDAEDLAKAKVFATVLGQYKGDKKIIFKFKKRKGYKRLRGHRQELTQLRIDAISPSGKKPAKPAKTSKKSVDADEDAAKVKAAAEAEIAAEAVESAEAVAEVKETPKRSRKKTEEVVASEVDVASAAQPEEEQAQDEPEAAEEKPKRKTTRKAQAEPADDSKEPEADSAVEVEKPKRKTTKKSDEDSDTKTAKADEAEA